tara:strand:+ start:317 stop:586 length:270 start_codon:yes stop_codon:yes gene_type:complete
VLINFDKIFKFIFTFAFVLGGWTSIILISNTPFNLEIKQVIHKMYLNQRNFIFNIKDLSFLLVRDANDRFSNKNQDLIDFKNLRNESRN